MKKIYIVLMIFLIILRAAADKILIDGNGDDWIDIDAEQFDDPEGDSTGSSDVLALSYARDVQNHYFLIRFKEKPATVSSIRYYLNIDFDFDNIAEVQFAAIYNSPGDTSKFTKEWKNYDGKPMSEMKGLKSKVGDVVEFQIPEALLNQKECFTFWFGLWDNTLKEPYIDGLSGTINYMQVEYTLKVVSREKHQTHITVFVQNSPFEKSEFYINTNIKINNIKATDKTGKKKIDISSGNKKYIAVNGINTDFIIEYDLLMNQDHPDQIAGYMGYLCPGYMLTCVDWTFLIPEKIPPVNTEVIFILPKDWEAITPWENTGKKFIETDFRKFRESTFGAGIFETQEKDVDGSLVTIAIDTHHDKVLREKMFEICYEIFTCFKSVFGAKGPEKHLSILAKNTGEYQWQAYNEGGLSQGEAVGNIDGTCFQYAHRIFHTFNIFYPCGMNIEPTWFVEGVNEYYDKLVAGSTRIEPPLTGLKNIYDIYLEKRDSLDGALTGYTRDFPNPEKGYFLPYTKGAIVAYLLDREIRKKTDNNKRLDDLLRSLYKTYGEFRNGTITDKIIEDELKNITGFDFGKFFTDYIHKVTKIDINDLFEDNDLDGIYNGGEELIGTDINNHDTDDDSATDRIEYLKGSDPRDSNSYPGERIFIDGFPDEWEKINHIDVEDEKGDQTGDIDIDKVSFFSEKGFLYILVIFKLKKNGKLERCYINIDNKGDNYPEINVGLYQGSRGDFARFKKNWETENYASLTEKVGCEAYMTRVAEFKLSPGILDAQLLNLTIGFWGEKGGIDSIYISRLKITPESGSSGCMLEKAFISLSKTLVGLKESLTITLANGNDPPHQKDWIGLYEADETPDGDPGSIWFIYLPDAGITSGNGSFIFDPVQVFSHYRYRYVAGRKYKFILAFDDSYTIQASVDFSVIE